MQKKPDSIITLEQIAQIKEDFKHVAENFGKGNFFRNQNITSIKKIKKIDEYKYIQLLRFISKIEQSFYQIGITTFYTSLSEEKINDLLTNLFYIAFKSKGNKVKNNLLMSYFKSNPLGAYIKISLNSSPVDFFKILKNKIESTEIVRLKQPDQLETYKDFEKYYKQANNILLNINLKKDIMDNINNHLNYYFPNVSNIFPYEQDWQDYEFDIKNSKPSKTNYTYMITTKIENHKMTELTIGNTVNLPHFDMKKEINLVPLFNRLLTITNALFNPNYENNMEDLMIKDKNAE